MSGKGGEKGGGLANWALWPHKSRGMFLVQPSSAQRWVRVLCSLEFIAAVKNCCEVACGRWSESADWSRPGWALLCCWALWESISLLRWLQGPVGRLLIIWHLSVTLDRHHRSHQLTINYYSTRQYETGLLFIPALCLRTNTWGPITL